MAVTTANVTSTSPLRGIIKQPTHEYVVEFEKLFFDRIGKVVVPPVSGNPDKDNSDIGVSYKFEEVDNDLDDGDSYESFDEIYLKEELSELDYSSPYNSSPRIDKSIGDAR